MTLTDPYAHAASLYVAAGWNSPIPLGQRGQRAVKAPVPKGFTGYAAKVPDETTIAKWIASHGGNNIGVHLGPGVIGIDVDHYTKGDKVKLGGDHLDALERLLGALPPTVRSTARGVDNPSGIRFYRVPVNVAEDGSITPLVLMSAIPDTDIEIIQASHRYAVVWPSIHPEGGRYEWYAPDGKQLGRVPRFSALPLLELP